MKLRNKRTGGLANCEPIEVSTDAGFHDYYSLAELNEEWEDAEGINARSMPLIKDKKIRKAVRAWAALYDWSAIRVHIGEDYVALFKDEVNGYSSSVEIDLSPEVFNELIDAHYYTIEELCGDEEE